MSRGHLPVDLHLHSTASDGSLSPARLIEKASAAGLAAVALTDHDTLDGVKAVSYTHLDVYKRQN